MGHNIKNVRIVWTNKFFSVGKKNQWRHKLNEDQLKKIENKCSKAMKLFNYK